MPFLAILSSLVVDFLTMPTMALGVLFIVDYEIAALTPCTSLGMLGHRSTNAIKYIYPKMCFIECWSNEVFLENGMPKSNKLRKFCRFIPFFILDYFQYTSAHEIVLDIVQQNNEYFTHLKKRNLWPLEKCSFWGKKNVS